MPNRKTPVTEKEFIRNGASVTLIPMQDTTNSVRVTIDRASLANNKRVDLVTIRVSISFTGGPPWDMLGGATTAGGVYRYRNGEIAEQSALEIRLPPGVNRLLRVAIRAGAKTFIKSDIEELE